MFSLSGPWDNHVTHSYSWLDDSDTCVYIDPRDANALVWIYTWDDLNALLTGLGWFPKFPPLSCRFSHIYTLISMNWLLSPPHTNCPVEKTWTSCKQTGKAPSIAVTYQCFVVKMCLWQGIRRSYAFCFCFSRLLVQADASLRHKHTLPPLLITPWPSSLSHPLCYSCCNSRCLCCINRREMKKKSLVFM